MNAASRILTGLFVIAACSGAIYLFRPETNPTIKLATMPKIVDSKPIGEIVADFRAEQRIKPPAPTARTRKLETLNLCADILLANYADRPNTGQFEIGLVLDGQEWLERIEASSVADNTRRSVCFQKLTVAQAISARAISLVIRGVSSPSGKAVTAWTTTDVSAGRLVAATDAGPPRSLVVTLSAEAVDGGHERNALVLVAFGAFIVATMLFAGRRGDELASAA